MQSQTNVPMMPMFTTTVSEQSAQLQRNLEVLEQAGTGDPDAAMQIQQLRDLMAHMTDVTPARWL